MGMSVPPDGIPDPDFIHSGQIWQCLNFRTTGLILMFLYASAPWVPPAHVSGRIWLTGPDFKQILPPTRSASCSAVLRVVPLHEK